MWRKKVILALNSGSSSLKFKLFTEEETPRPLLTGHIRDIHSGQARLQLSGGSSTPLIFPEGIDSIEKAVRTLIHWLKQQTDYDLAGIVYRVVQGGTVYSAPTPVTGDFIQELSALVPLAPLHLPDNIKVLQQFYQHFPGVFQLACFDTWFHRQMPFEARHLPLPRNLWKEGLLRYGFHGLSCQSILLQLEQSGYAIKEKKIIIAHLGSGCSMTAVQNGESKDTSMGFSPASGMMMQTRSGDTDPNLLLYLLTNKKKSPEELSDLFNKQAGLNAVSGTTAGVKELLEKENSDSRAAEAIRLFCYQAKKQIGALAAVLNGLDLLVFTGGIGEQEALIRMRICEGLDFLGIRLDSQKNEQQETVITAPDSKVSVQVIATDEESILARQFIDIVQFKKQYTHYAGAT